MKRRNVVFAASAGGLAGLLGLTVLTLPAGANEDPQLPPVAPEQLVESALTATPPALSGTVRVDNALGLPSLPGAEGGAASMLADGTSTLRVWNDGQGHKRASVPSASGEVTVVDDGATIWKWDSQSRTATKGDKQQHGPGAHPGGPGGHGADAAAQDPATLSREIVGQLRQTSDVAVDGTARVAGRDAYELVLTPKPTERTVLREVRLAVDAQTRSPLEVTVLTNGSDDPALRAGFSDLDLSQPDPAMFRFTPPEGAKVEDQASGERSPENRPENRPEHPAGHHPTVVGDGWDTVLVTRLPQTAEHDEQPGRPESPHGFAPERGGERMDPQALARQLGKPVNGPWGDGWLISTKVGSALVTSDGRVAAGAVPEQVLTAAVGNP
ncbi:outer membrane lipoprotein carrier protein LolA [Saccharopolyspora gloriosae]|uniref:LolA family protein n=1 Tax=Saccharopolyspora gloriosae TaxID=455344 RepID=UPI001FB70102|nr:outer membrane lipoprotein carrier protein LolA [Saccharopolyspora gloriosae]